MTQFYKKNFVFILSVSLVMLSVVSTGAQAQTIKRVKLGTSDTKSVVSSEETAAQSQKLTDPSPAVASPAQQPAALSRQPVVSSQKTDVSGQQKIFSDMQKAFSQQQAAPSRQQISRPSPSVAVSKPQTAVSKPKIAPVESQVTVSNEFVVKLQGELLNAARAIDAEAGPKDNKSRDELVVSADNLEKLKSKTVVSDAEIQDAVVFGKGKFSGKGDDLFYYLVARACVSVSNHDALGIYDAAAKEIYTRIHGEFYNFTMRVIDVCRMEPVAVDEFCSAARELAINRQREISKFFSEIKTQLEKASGYTANLCAAVGLCCNIMRYGWNDDFWVKFWRVNNALRDHEAANQLEFLDRLVWIETEGSGNGLAFVNSLHGSGWEWVDTAKTVGWEIGKTKGWSAGGGVSFGFKAIGIEISGEYSESTTMTETESTTVSRHTEQVARIWAIFDLWVNYSQQHNMEAGYKLKKAAFATKNRNVVAYIWDGGASRPTLAVSR